MYKRCICIVSLFTPLTNYIYNVHTSMGNNKWAKGLLWILIFLISSFLCCIKDNYTYSKQFPNIEFVYNLQFLTASSFIQTLCTCTSKKSIYNNNNAMWSLLYGKHQ